MGTEVASRPSIPSGLSPNCQGPGPRRKHERERSFCSSGSAESSGNAKSGKPIYSRDYHLRIQRKKYSLATSIVCIGAKIHQRYSPASHDEGTRDHNVFPENTKYSNSSGSKLREVSFISDLTHSQIRSRNNVATNQNPSPNFSNSQDYKSVYRTGQLRASPCDVEYQNVTKNIDGCHELSLRLADFEGELDESFSFPLPSKKNTGISHHALPIGKYYHNRRGLSRVDHPTGALEIVDHQSLPREFSKKIVEAISSYQATPLSSNRSSPTITEDVASSNHSIVQGDLWGTGNTTERSSVDSQYSWDEFDRQAAKTVQKLFDDIDSVLYELRPNQAENNKNECQEWGTLFPHLRVLGRQLVPGQEAGYEMIEREMIRPSTTSSMGLEEITDHDLSINSQDSQGLSVSGRRMRAIVPPPEARSRASGTPSTQKSEFSFLEEEVYEVEGDYEEVIAIDYKDIYEDHSDHKKQLTPRRRRVAYPPITPNACFKDSVASSAFDCVWQEIISWIRPLLKKYSIIILDNSKPLSQSIQQALRLESTPGPPSRENSQIKSLGQRAHTMIGVETRQIDSPNLDNLLLISKKIPIHREQTLVDFDPPPSIITTRPNSSFPSYGGGKRPPSTRIIMGPRNRNSLRLAPLQQDRSKTPSVDEEQARVALRVRRIEIQQTSSPTYNTRNGALPPIGTPLDLEPNSRLQKKLVSSRASSAVDKDIRVAYKDRLFGAPDTRPSTTHAFRSETPQGLMGRRASTPFHTNPAFSNQSISRNSHGLGMHLDIRGNGLQPSHEMSNLGNIPQEEDHEGMEEPVHANQWTPSTPSHNNPYRRGRQMSSLVRS